MGLQSVVKQSKSMRYCFYKSHYPQIRWKCVLCELDLIGRQGDRVVLPSTTNQSREAGSNHPYPDDS